MLTQEQKARDAILAWCRSNPRGYGAPCMRIRPLTGICTVVDVLTANVDTIAMGNSWLDVLADMHDSGIDVGVYDVA